MRWGGREAATQVVIHRVVIVDEGIMAGSGWRWGWMVGGESWC